jgi:hypothetical protein
MCLTFTMRRHTLIAISANGRGEAFELLVRGGSRPADFPNNTGRCVHRSAGRRSVLLAVLYSRSRFLVADKVV